MTTFYIAAHGIIWHGNKILATRRSAENDFMPLVWDFAGGKIEAGETAEEGLKREIREETGLEVTIENIEHVYTDVEELPEAQYVMLTYKCVYTDGDVTLNPEEHDDYKWVTVDELKTMEVVHFVESWLKSITP